VEISKNVPIPPAKRAGAKRVYPFNEMEAGDSLSIVDTTLFEKARRAAAEHAKKHKWLFRSRKGYQGIEHTGKGGTIWRVE